MIFTYFILVKLEFVIAKSLIAGKCLLPLDIKLNWDAIGSYSILGVTEAWWKPVRLITAELWNTKLLFLNTKSHFRHSGIPYGIPSLPFPSNHGLHSTSKGDHLSGLVNLSWSSLHSLHPVSGEDRCQSVCGWGCYLHLRRTILCNALPRGWPISCCVWG